MSKLVAICLSVFCACGWCLAGESASSVVTDQLDEIPSGAPEKVRGRLMAGRIMTGQNYPYKLLQVSAEDLRQLDRQEVEITGYVGTKRRIPTMLVTERPKIVVPVSWTAPFAMLLVGIVIVPLISRRFFEQYFGFVALALGLSMAVFYVVLLEDFGRHKMIVRGLAGLTFMVPALIFMLIRAKQSASHTGKWTAIRNAALIFAGFFCTLSPVLDYLALKQNILSEQRFAIFMVGLPLLILLALLRKPAGGPAPEHA